MFFDIFEALCKAKGVSCKAAVSEIGLSNSIATKWKKTGATPSGETLSKIAEYFGVSVDFLLEDSPSLLELVARDNGLNEAAALLQRQRKERYKINDSEIRAAFFNGSDEGLTEADKAELWQDAREYIAYKAEQKRKKK